jgi:imidazole glycerol-phosphate synthase subunit HisH
MINHLGGKARIAENPNEIADASKIILPGVGSYDSAMKKLIELGLVEPLKQRARAGIPFLGICLGMQLLANSSEEGDMAGLALIPGVVRKLRSMENEGLKIPHMGWNYAKLIRDHPIGRGLQGDARFYFVHSYYFECESMDDSLFRTIHGYEFTSGIQRGNIIGVQFHPEKSHRFGMQIISNFINL